jgi:hypothetical protein
MTSQSIAISLQPAAADQRGDRWVRLEQAEHPEVMQYANLYDIDQMMARARSGLSAWSYVKDSCPITINDDGTVDVALDFYSFPSAFDFTYAVSASIGTVGERIRVEQERELDIIFTGSRVDLPWFASMASVEWISPVFRSDGSQIARPHITIEDAALVADADDIAFGVARLRCIAHGYLHTTVIRLVKQTTEQDEDGNVNTTGYKIENLRCAATAAWQDEDGAARTEQLDLDIPKCVEDYLATCEDGEPKGGTRGGDDEEPRPVVYYNDCTGSVLLVVYPEET